MTTASVKGGAYTHQKQSVEAHRMAPHKFPPLEETRSRVSRFSRAPPGPAPVKENSYRAANDINGRTAKNTKNGDESFDAEDNENELSSLAVQGGGKDKTVKQPVQSNKSKAIFKVSKYTAAVSTAKKVKKVVPEHFEQEMDKHGLLDKIVHIQQLNNYFENELGGANKKVDAPSPVAGRTSPNTTLDKGYAFPFQKRARSNSPPKNGALFIPKAAERSPEQSPADSRAARVPVVARTNFVIGKAAQHLKFSPRDQAVDQFLKSLDSDDDFCCGLSTGPTDEIKGGGVVEQHEERSDVDSWMYQRINYAELNKEGGEENVVVGEEEEGVSFLQMLNQAKFDK